VHEDIEVFLLQFQGDLGSGFRIIGRAHDGGKTGCSAIDKLNATLSEDNVVGRAKPQIVLGGILGLGIEVGLVQIADGLEHLLGKKGGHASIQGRGQVGQPQILGNHLGQQLPALLENFLHVAKFLDLGAKNGIDNGQKIRGIGKGNLLLGTELDQGVLIGLLGHIYDVLGAANSCRTDDLGHRITPYAVLNR